MRILFVLSRWQKAVYIPKSNRTEMLSTFQDCTFRDAPLLLLSKFETAAYMPNLNRTEMLCTVQDSKFRVASFVKD